MTYAISLTDVTGLATKIRPPFDPTVLLWTCPYVRTLHWQVIVEKGNNEGFDITMEARNLVAVSEMLHLVLKKETSIVVN